MRKNTGKKYRALSVRLTHGNNWWTAVRDGSDGNGHAKPRKRLVARSAPHRMSGREGEIKRVKLSNEGRGVEAEARRPDNKERSGYCDRKSKLLLRKVALNACTGSCAAITELKHLDHANTLET